MVEQRHGVALTAPKQKKERSYPGLVGPRAPNEVGGARRGGEGSIVERDFL